MIVVEKIQKKFDNFEIKKISFQIQEGEYFVILGPSGSGKTLILELIAGLTKPDSGRISGMEGKRLGLIYQDYMLFPHLTVSDNIAYGLKIKKCPKEKIDTLVKESASRLGISHLLQRGIQSLSGGEKQRVAIARALVIKPDIFLLDEPTAALDLSTKLKTQRLFMKLHKEHSSSVVHVTHDFEEALALGDRIALLIEGRIIQIGKPEEVFNNPVNKEAAGFLGYKNVFFGEIRDHNLLIEGIEVTTPLETTESAYVAIGSNDIILSKKKIISSARNSFYGKVREVINRGILVEVIVDIGVLLHVDVTYRSLKEMKIVPGSELWVTFKTASIKVFEH